MARKRYVCLNDFLAIAQIKERTFKKRMKEIKGVHVINGVIRIEEGTRYPLPKRYKARGYNERLYLILKATDINRYIDHLYLGLYPKQFYDMIDKLVEKGLLEPNGMTNRHGANQYNCTDKGAKVLEKKKRESIEWVAKLMAECAGKYSGEVLTKLMKK